MTHYKNYGNNEYLCISDNDTYEYFEDENLYKNDNQFREYLNYDEIISNVGNHNNKDTYLYLLLRENAYDKDKDEYINYIKIGYAARKGDPINRFHEIYSYFYPRGEMKILMLIKMSNAKPYEQEIHKLCSEFKLKNIMSTKFKVSKECYLYNDVKVKNIVNSYLLKNKKDFLSYYFDKESNYFSNFLNTQLNEKESKNYKSIVKKDHEFRKNINYDEIISSIGSHVNNDRYLYLLLIEHA